MGDPTDDLATALFALEAGALTTGVMTRLITGTVVQWALAKGWTARVEARVEGVSAPGSAKLGFLDIVVSRSGEPDLAIEIDSGDKPWSVDKLKHAAQAGMHAIWIRWGDSQWAGIYDDLDVIQLWLHRRPARRRSPADQLGFW